MGILTTLFGQNPFFKWLKIDFFYQNAAGEHQNLIVIPGKQQ